jgi:hypothetical protein
MVKDILALPQGLVLEPRLDPLSVTNCGVGSEILAGRLRPEGGDDA